MDMAEYNFVININCSILIKNIKQTDNNYNKKFTVISYSKYYYQTV